MGHVSCNTAADIDNSEVEVSSPMGHVSCNCGILRKSGRLYVSSPMGHVSCNTVKSNFNCHHSCFVPYGACELQRERFCKLIMYRMFRPLWGM